MNLIIDLDFKKSTKGTHVYEAADPDAAVQTLYIKKDAVQATASVPQSITITVQYGE